MATDMDIDMGLDFDVEDDYSMVQPEQVWHLDIPIHIKLHPFEVAC